MTTQSCTHIKGVTAVKHATRHATATSHPVIASAEPGERWLSCYPDDTFAEY